MNLPGENDKRRRLSPSDATRAVDPGELKGRLSPYPESSLRSPSYAAGAAALGLRGILPLPDGYQRATEAAEARLARANDFNRSARALLDGWAYGASDDIRGKIEGISVAGQNALADRGLGAGKPYGPVDADRATRDVVDRDIRRFASEHAYARTLGVIGELTSPINWLTGGLGALAGGGLRGAVVAGGAGGLLEGVAKSHDGDRLRDGLAGANVGALAGDVTYVPKAILGSVAERYAPAFAKGYMGKLAGRALDKATEAWITKGVRETANRIRESYREAGLRSGYPLPASDAEGAGLRGPQPLVIPEALRGPLR